MVAAILESLPTCPLDDTLPHVVVPSIVVGCTLLWPLIELLPTQVHVQQRVLALSRRSSTILANVMGATRWQAVHITSPPVLPLAPHVGEA